MRNIDEIFQSLSNSTFRQRFHLDHKDAAYLKQKSIPIVLDHARKFIGERLAAARPKNDGKQTPFRGHPIFVAQHATATCCRSCLEKWHNIPMNIRLSEEHKLHILAVLERWLIQELQHTASS